MVEFAIVIPIMLFVLFAIMQFGIVFKDYLALTDGVRAGARKGAVSRQYTSRHSLVEAAVRKSAPGLAAGELDVDVSTSWAPGSDIEVTASYPYSINVLGLVVASGRLESTTTERVE
jgi:Flp pilus assembly protein TadG